MEKLYLYESHLGGLYTSPYELDYDYLYCEECGDSDWCIGEASTRAAAWDLLKDDTEKTLTGDAACKACGEEGSSFCEKCDRTYQTGGWDPEYVNIPHTVKVWGLGESLRAFA